MIKLNDNKLKHFYKDTINKMKKIKLISTLLLFSFSFSANAFAEEVKPEYKDIYPKLNLNLEYGFLGVLAHQVQFSKDNTKFDYVTEGGQKNLFAIGKLSTDFQFNAQHSAVFLYQPLSLESQATLAREIKQDNIIFPQNTPMKFLYDFPFFRGSYLYDFNPDSFEELSFGASLQLRNATIEFESLDGKSLVSRRDVGPVPALKFRSRNKIGDIFWFGSEIDGFYAPVRYLNGGTTDVVGAILDANIRFGANLSDKYYPYINLRYIGGGGTGTSTKKQLASDGYTDNWLNFLVVTLGISTSIF